MANYATISIDGEKATEVTTVRLTPTQKRTIQAKVLMDNSIRTPAEYIRKAIAESLVMV